MLAGARHQRRRRQLQQPQQPQQPRWPQPLPWPMNADPPPPPWVWMVPGTAGLLQLGAGVAPPPVLLASAQPASASLLPRLPGWPAPGEPLLPLLPLSSAPDHAAVHHYPLLHGQVTAPAPVPPRLSIAGLLSWDCPDPRVGVSPSLGGSGFPTPSGRGRAVIHWQESSCFDVRFCFSSFCDITPAPRLSLDRFRPSSPG